MKIKLRATVKQANLSDFEAHLEKNGYFSKKDYEPYEFEGQIIGAHNLRLYRGDLEDLMLALSQDSDLPQYEFNILQTTKDPEGESEMDYLKVDIKPKT